METNPFGSLLVVFLSLIIAVPIIVGGWKMFVKAGKPGWAFIIPFYNVYVLLKIAGKPGWWLILLLIPGVNLIISAITAVSLAKAFGKGVVFGIILLWLIAPFGYLIIGFDSSKYIGYTAPQPNQQSPQSGQQQPQQQTQAPQRSPQQQTPQQSVQPPQGGQQQ